MSKNANSAFLEYCCRKCSPSQRRGAVHIELIHDIILGVVYNEMKGAYSDSQQLFGQHLMNNLMPSHTYSYSSGGFPLKIPGEQQ
jgi:Zn-dependent M16 (insulinase) family peptidase